MTPPGGVSRTGGVGRNPMDLAGDNFGQKGLSKTPALER